MARTQHCHCHCHCHGDGATRRRRYTRCSSTSSFHLIVLAVLCLSISHVLCLSDAGNASPDSDDVVDIKSGTSLLQISVATHTGRVRRLIPTHTHTQGDDADILLTPESGANVHLGDVNLKVKGADGTAFQACSSVGSVDVRAKQQLHQPYSYELKLTSRANASLCHQLGVNVAYGFEDDTYNLFVQWEVHNTQQQSISLGGVGFPLPFDNDARHKQGSRLMTGLYLVEPYIGGAHGYAVASRLDGRHNVAVIPGATSLRFANGTTRQLGRTRLEAWRPVDESTRERDWWHEGVHEWVVHSHAYREDEWANAGEPWLQPTHMQLPPGATATFSLQLHRADAARAHGVPVAACTPSMAALRAVPSLTIARDMATARLLVYKPTTLAIRAFKVHPRGALRVFVERRGTRKPLENEAWCGAADNTPREIVSIRVYGRMVGRARVVLLFDDGSDAVANYHVTPPFALSYGKAVRALGTHMWLGSDGDPFGRKNGVQLYDRLARKVVMQSSRSFAVGLSDDGALSGVAALGIAAAYGKAHVSPRFVAMRLDSYINRTLLGGRLQNATTHALVGSLFYQPGANGVKYEYAPSGWRTWSYERSTEIWRSYNYPWIIAMYTSLALLARDEGSSEHVTEQSAKWYLSHAVGTVRSMMKHGGPNCELFGTSRANLCNQASKAHIGASMWWELMRLLEVESMHSELDEIRSIVLSRLSNWEQEKYAYTSEFSFDTMSPEEVISWALYHGVKARDDKRDRLVKEATSFIRSYTSEVAHWAYHGSSRGYWDFDMLGKEGAHYLNGDVASAECANEANPDCVIERGLHHYRSAINAHALLEVYQASPEDSMHLLRTAMGGLTGVLASVDKDGLHSLAYHSAPRIMRYDDYSGDSAVSWFYMARLSASFVAFDTGLSSWLCFLCDFLHASDVKHAKILQSLPGSSADVLSWTPRDAMQTRTFLSPMRAMVEIRGGSSRIVRVHANLRKCESTLEVIASSSSFQVVVAAWSVTNGKDVVVRRSDAPDAPVCRCSRPVGVLAGKSYCACASHGTGAFQSTNTTKPTSSHVHAKIIVSW